MSDPGSQNHICPNPVLSGSYHPLPHLLATSHIFTHTHAHTHTHARTHAHTCMHAHMHRHAHKCTHTHAHASPLGCFSGNPNIVVNKQACPWNQGPFLEGRSSSLHAILRGHSLLCHSCTFQLLSCIEDSILILGRRKMYWTRCPKENLRGRQELKTFHFKWKIALKHIIPNPFSSRSGKYCVS